MIIGRQDEARAPVTLVNEPTAKAWREEGNSVNPQPRARTVESELHGWDSGTSTAAQRRVNDCAAERVYVKLGAR